ncbi:MAG: hypothetical protein J6O40_06625 [Ruminococcus sp.]|nr:hypothetical protein [Ruminococcus sp.]
MPSNNIELLKDLKEFKKKIKDNKELSAKVDGFIDFCNKNKGFDNFDIFSQKESLFDFERKEQEEKKKKTADMFVIRVHYIQELEEEAKKLNDNSLNDNINKIASSHKLTDDEIKTLQNFENEHMLKKVEEQKTTSLEFSKMDEIYKDISSEKLMAPPEGTDPYQYQKDTEPEFEKAKAALQKHFAKALAVKTFGRTISSMAVGDESVTEHDKDEMAKEMLTDENINSSAKDIQTRDDFTRMMQDIRTWRDLRIVTQEAQAGGNLLFKRLADTTKRMLAEERQAEQAQKQTEAEKELNKERVLKPQNQRNMFG